MKKIKLLLLFFCVIPVAVLREGGRQTAGGTTASGIAYMLPTQDVDFSDLDMRDAQNRPIAGASAAEKLAALFRENLVSLKVFAIPHSLSESLNWINSISHLVNRTILTPLRVLFEWFME